MVKADKDYLDSLIEYAYELGAVDAVYFDVKDIVFDPRTLLKCMYGCEDWGFGLTCPSANPQVTMEQYEKMFKKYSYGIIVHANDKKTNHDVSYLLERPRFHRRVLYGFFRFRTAPYAKDARALMASPAQTRKKRGPLSIRWA